MVINTNSIKMIRTFVTGSRRGDLLVFTLLACLIVATGYRLRVYYQVTVIDVSLVRVASDGTRETLPTPRQFRRVWSVNEPSAVLPALERRIEKYMKNYSRLIESESVERYEWVIRYSFNSTRLDSRRVIAFRAGDIE